MSSNGFMIAFGVAEIIFSQIPDFDQVWWLSIVAAIMSFTYSTVGLGLGIGKVAGTTKLTFWLEKKPKKERLSYLRYSMP